MTVVKGADVVKEMVEELRREVQEMESRGVHPCAKIVRVGDNPSCIAYGKGAAKKLESVGIQVEYATFPEDISQKDFLVEFQKINEDQNVHGILLLRPLPAQLDEKEISRVIDPRKDVDAISPINMYKVMVGDNTAFPPCTPEAVMRIIDHIGIDLTGKKVAIVGASMVVGRPLFLLMLNRNATCVQCHIYTKDLAAECKHAEIIVVAAGKQGLIRLEHVSPGATVIDVGINIGEDGKIHGDVDFDAVAPVTNYITPVPGGVGSVTSTVLAAHVVKAAKLLYEH